MHWFCIRSIWIAPTPANLSLRIIRPTHHVYPLRFLSNAKARTSQPDSVQPPVTTKVEYQFSPQHVARVASQAIRQAICEGNVRSASYIVYSMLQSSSDTRIKPLPQSLTPSHAMKFGRPVPPRQAAHSLIHGLLRQGFTLEAGKELQKFLALGVRFHYKTLEANVDLLCTKPSQVSEYAEDFVANPSTSLEESEASHLIVSQSTRLPSEIHLALNILSTARQSRHRRTGKMYDRLVNACLLQGEIVVGTLLFVLLVKDWQLRRIVQSVPIESEEDAGMDSVDSREHSKGHLHRHGLSSMKHARQLGMDDTSLPFPYPEKKTLQSILNSINHHILSRDSHDTCRLGCIESLSLLANLLQQRSLPFGQLSPLIRTLQNCPSSPSYRTGSFRDGRFIEVNVYEQVHEVLYQLCGRLPRLNASTTVDRPGVLPRLDLRAYNSLLYYALRHRLSPALANGVIEHMTVHRNPPLHPDTVTYNTLLRSASLLRRNDIASDILEKFRLRPENADHVVNRIRPDASNVNMQSSRRNKNQRLHPLSKRIESQQLTVPEFSEAEGRPLRADFYTLSSYITYLVSIGRPDLVADMIFELVPELRVIDHPAGNSPLMKPWSREERLERRKECISRVVEYGPYVFSALLNALRKAGKTGLAERVWLLARQAERASWMPSDSLGKHTPWILPIQAYTSMMQCYADESRKGLAYVRGTRFSTSSDTLLSSAQRRSPWIPSRNQKNKIFVRGWAYFYLRMRARERGFQATEPPLRWETSREVGWLLHGSMRRGAISVWQELMQMQPDRVQKVPPGWAVQLQSLKLPVPDERFFNAVLDIFGRRPGMQMRRVRANPSWWKRKLRVTQHLYASTGWMSLVYDYTLVKIAKEMAQAGHTLPLGLQRVLVGRATFQVRQNMVRRYEVRPWAFPPCEKPGFQAFAIPVTRTRGLPNRSSPPRLRRRRVRARSRQKQRAAEDV